jgi:hypothetical protein
MGQRHYFGSVEPCLRDDHAFRFDLRFGSFNDWSRLGLASNLSKALFFYPYLDNPLRRHSTVRGTALDRNALAQLATSRCAAFFVVPASAATSTASFEPKASGVVTVEHSAAGNMESLLDSKPRRELCLCKPLSAGGKS